MTSTERNKGRSKLLAPWEIKCLTRTVLSTTDVTVVIRFGYFIFRLKINTFHISYSLTQFYLIFFLSKYILYKYNIFIYKYISIQFLGYKETTSCDRQLGYEFHICCMKISMEFDKLFNNVFRVHVSYIIYYKVQSLVKLIFTLPLSL